jgi:hypothetical protein
MKLLFGHWASVSSSLKLGRALDGVGVIAGNSLQIGTTFRLVLGMAIAVVAALSLPHQSAKLRRIYMGGLLGVTCFTFGHVLFSEIRSWYFLPLYGVAWWVASSPLKLPAKSSSLGKWRALAMCAVMLMTFGAAVWKGYQFAAKSVRSEKAWSFVAKVEDLVPPGELVYEIDASGFPGFWSRRGIVNGDGLVNSYEYARRLTSNQLNGYLEEQGICYVIVTGRVVSQEVGQLLDFHGLRLQTSDLRPMYPSDSVRKEGTQLVRRIALGCP